MVFACDSAVVVKGRDGRTVLLHSRGLDMQRASRAATEALAALQAASQGLEPWDVLSNSQSPPLLCGRVEIAHSSLAVTYRVVGTLILMVVSPPTANVFACVNLLGQVARVALAPAEGKATEATPERFQRRFAEIYLAVDALMGSGGVLDANAALGRALATLEQLNEKDKEGGGKGGKGGQAPEAPKTPPQQPARAARTKRTLQGAIDQLSLMSFFAGAVMQSIPPLPGFQLPDAAGGPRLHVGPHDPFSPLQGPPILSPPSSAPSADPFGDDDIFNLSAAAKKAAETAAAKAAKKADSDDPFSASEAAPPDWKSFEGGKDGKEGVVGFEDNAFGDAASAAPPPLVPSEPVLRLVEVWRGEAAGGQLARAGLSGRVEWVSEAAKSKVHTVQFMLQGPQPPNEHLAAALTTARRHPVCCRVGPTPGVLVADGIQAKQHAGAPLLAYHLPPVACRPPLQVQLGSSWQALQDGRRLVTVGLYLALDPRLAPHTAGLDVEVTVPAVLEQPLRVAPPGASFDAKARVLRWHQGGPVQVADNNGAVAEPFMAVFVVGETVADEAALAAALGRVTASLQLEGVGGTDSISGAALAQGVVELELTKWLCGWRAQIRAVP